MRLCKTAGLLALPAVTLAVTLSDFKSDADTLKEADLPADCAKVYKSNISECQASDFTGGNGCSQGCVDALHAMVDKVKSACGSDNLGGTSIITVFLNGNGPGAICPNAGAASATSSSSQSSVPQTTEASSTSSVTKSSATIPEPTSTSSARSNTTSVTSASTTSATTILIVDTSSAAIPSPTQSSSQTGFSSHSGQGSPFDPVYPGAASAVSFASTTVALAVAAVFLAALR